MCDTNTATKPSGAVTAAERTEGTCTCVECAICSGTGFITLSDGLGHYDAEREVCDDCDHGVVEECDYCVEQRERDEDEHRA
jgi:hypothetical protein